MADHVQLFLDFIRKSPSAFHAVKTLCDALDAGGFTPLSETQPWRVVPGGKYYVTRNLSSVIAFAVPETGFAHFQIVSSHSDSPTFKLKHIFEDETAGGYLRLNVERYGGMIMSTWLDRPLSIAGRVLVREGSALFVPEFTEAAFSLQNIGDVSDPVRTAGGVHFILYAGDVPAGPVSPEEIWDALAVEAQNRMADEAYDAQVAAWVAEAAPVYHPEYLLQ